MSLPNFIIIQAAFPDFKRPVKRNSGGEEIYPTRPDRPRGPSNLLQDAYQVSFLGVKRPKRSVNHPPPSNTKVKERVELYF